jgi:hypothetical protein
MYNIYDQDKSLKELSKIFIKYSPILHRNKKIRMCKKTFIHTKSDKSIRVEFIQKLFIQKLRSIIYKGFAI